MIHVTKTFLPAQEEYNKILEEAWRKGWITNRGVLVNRLEEKLKNYLDVSNILATTNGTLPIQIAIKSLQLDGEIITTPFSYVATTSSIVWEGCTPVFVDIHPGYLTIDETKIEAAITNKTSAILATHVFGNPCHVEAIEKIACKHNLKVIYDAAHCFGVTYKNQSIFEFGDVSTCSFHATKIFHTGEGGAIFCNDDLMDKIYYHHNFGHHGKEDFKGVGINAKMSELQAALGLSVFPYLESIIDKRKVLVTHYENCLGDHVRFLKVRANTVWNYHYFPVIFSNEELLLKTIEALNKENIFPRRYFYPSLNTLPYISAPSMKHSEDIAKRVLCLPLYFELETCDVDKITSIILNVK